MRGARGDRGPCQLPDLQQRPHHADLDPEVDLWGQGGAEDHGDLAEVAHAAEVKAKGTGNFNKSSIIGVECINFSWSFLNLALKKKTYVYSKLSHMAIKFNSTKKKAMNE